MSIKSEAGRRAIINTYLSSAQDYEQGLHIYIKYGKNEALKKILSIGATTYNHKKLLDVLRAMIEEGAPGQVAPEAYQEAPALSKKISAGAASAAVVNGTKPEKGKQIFKPGRWAVAPNHPELIKLYRERAFLKSQIPLLQSALDRMNAAFRILYLSEEVERILFTGLPGQYLPSDRAELVKKAENNRKYISKYKQAPEKVDEVRRRQAENQAIQTTLQNDGK